VTFAVGDRVRLELPLGIYKYDDVVFRSGDEGYVIENSLEQYTSVKIDHSDLLLQWACYCLTKVTPLMALAEAAE